MNWLEKYRARAKLRAEAAVLEARFIHEKVNNDPNKFLTMNAHAKVVYAHNELGYWWSARLRHLYQIYRS